MHTASDPVDGVKRSIRLDLYKHKLNHRFSTTRGATSMDAIGTGGPVRREVRADERDGEPTRVVVASQEYPAGIDDVWDAVTNPERLPRWFLPVTGESDRRRSLPVRGQRRRRGAGLRQAGTRAGDLGVRRRGQLAGAPADRSRRSDPAAAGARRAAGGPVVRVRTGSGRRRLGPVLPRTGQSPGRRSRRHAGHARWS